MTNHSSGMGRDNTRPVPAHQHTSTWSFLAPRVRVVAVTNQQPGNRQIGSLLGWPPKVVYSLRLTDRVRLIAIVQLSAWDSSAVPLEGPMIESKKTPFEFRPEEIGMLKVALALHVKTLGGYTRRTDRAQQMMYRALLRRIEHEMA